MTDGPQYLRRQPHNVPAEAAVLGTILFDDRVWSDVGHRLVADDFTLLEHRLLWSVIARAKAAGQRVDPVLLRTWAEAEPALEQQGGSRYLVALADGAVPRALVSAYADQVAECAERCRLIDAGQHLVDSAYSGNGTLADTKAFVAEELTATRSLMERGNLIRVADCQGRPLPDRKWLMEDWLPVGHVTSLYGDGGVGKSLLAQQAITAHAAGAPWLGLPTVPCPTMGLFAEDGIDELIIRQDAINRDLGIDFGNLPDLHLWSLLGEDAMLMEIDRSGRGYLTPAMA